MVLLYAATGTTILPEISARIGTAGVLGIVAVVLVTAGLGFKIAAVPFHMWVPDVYQGAPTPTTAFLSVASKSAGFALALRFFSQGLMGIEVAWQPMLAVLAAITMTVGNVAALRQTNIKRLLGYSSIAQAGYAMMALAVPSPEVASGLMYFLLAYTLTNLGAFAGIIAIGNQIGSDEIEDYRGLGQRAGALALLTTLCFLSLVGMPPMAGFVSKFYLFLRVFEQGLVWVVLVAVLNTAIAAYYYIKVIRAMYFAAPAGEGTVSASGSLRVALWAATAATILVGVWAAPFLGIAGQAGRALFP
jgi:NADH-quinone oxidoreductase subunit N